MKIQRVGTDIKNIIRKNRSGAIKEVTIGESIIHAEKDLFNDLIAAYRGNGYLSELLHPFVVKNETVAFASGIGTTANVPVVALNGSVADPTSGVLFNPVTILDDPKKFRTGSIDEIMVGPEGQKSPNSAYLEKVSIAALPASLPPHFIQAKGAYTTVGGEDYQAIELKPEEWGTRDIAKISSGEEQNVSDLNIVETTITAANMSTGKVAVPAGFVKLLSGTATISGTKYECTVVQPEDFDSRRFKEIAINGDIKPNLSIVKATISLTGGIGDLPADFVQDKGMFQAGDAEGIILDTEEFLDRNNSVILAPDLEEPIARVFNDQIEVSPSSISTIDIYYYAFPTAKNPAVTVIDNEIHVYPIPAVDIDFRYVRNATTKRSVFSMVEGGALIDPDPGTSGNPLTIMCYVFPSARNPIARVSSSTLEILPSSITSSTFTYIKELTSAVYAIALRGDGRGYEFSVGTSTDTQFGENATQELVARALKYLGIPYKDQAATQLDKI
jgi:hypothetical protein